MGIKKTFFYCFFPNFRKCLTIKKKNFLFLFFIDYQLIVNLKNA